MGEENFLKEAFLPPNPYLSRTFEIRGFLGLHSAFNACEIVTIRIL